MKKLVTFLILIVTLLFSCTKNIEINQEIPTAKNGKKNPPVSQAALAAPAITFVATVNGRDVTLVWTLSPQDTTVIKWIKLAYQHEDGPLYNFPAPWDGRWVEYDQQYWNSTYSRTEGYTGTFRYVITGSYGKPNDSESSMSFWQYSNAVITN